MKKCDEKCITALWFNCRPGDACCVSGGLSIKTKDRRLGYQEKGLLETRKKWMLAKYGYWKRSEGLVVAVTEGDIEGRDSA